VFVLRDVEGLSVNEAVGGTQISIASGSKAIAPGAHDVAKNPGAAVETNGAEAEVWAWS